MNEEKVKVTALDIRIVIAVAICYFTSVAFKQFNLMFLWNGVQLEIIQGMTACFACLLCCQDNTAVSKKAGINRLIITAIGGLVGICVILIDQAAGNPWLMVPLIAFGVLLTLLLCKAAKVPYINARIGGLTFILVCSTMPGTARIFYAAFRLLSTLYGVLITLLVTWVCTSLTKKKQPGV